MTTQLAPAPILRVYDNSGNLAIGGQIYTYAAGTSTPIATYTDSTGTTQQANPIILNSRGEASIWLTPGTAYKFVAYDALNNLLWTEDQISNVNTSAIFSGSNGSSLIGFTQMGASSSITVQAKLQQYVSVKDFGAKGDGTTDDTSAISLALSSLSAGGQLFFPAGTYLISNASALNITVPNVTLFGVGAGSIIKANNAANLVYVISATVSGVMVKDLVIDGNRANGGINPTNYGLYVSASNFKAINLEIRYCPSYGTFIGSGSASPTNIVFENCWIHDNGGVTNSSGFGCGIYGAGAFPCNDVRISNCRIENNYNTVTAPGQSNGINLLAKNIHVTNCFFQNNYNVGGGQLDLVSDTVNGATDGIFIISNNTISQTSTFGSDLTCGIEIDGRKVVCTGNTVMGATADGVRIESSAGDAVISNNILSCTSVGVNLITSGGNGIYRTRVSDNQIIAASIGIQLQTGASTAYDVIENNYIDPSVTTKIGGAQYAALIRGNYGYTQAIQTGITAGASPYAFPLLNYDAVYSISAVNGAFSMNVDGVQVSTAANIPVFVKAGHLLTVFWATTAPVFGIAPQP